MRDVARMKPTGAVFGRPDDKLRAMRGRPFPDCGASRLHPGYKSLQGDREVIRGALVEQAPDIERTASPPPNDNG
jgi:hypothetical protein